MFSKSPLWKFFKDLTLLLDFVLLLLLCYNVKITILKEKITYGAYSDHKDYETFIHPLFWELFKAKIKSIQTLEQFCVSCSNLCQTTLRLDWSS